LSLKLIEGKVTTVGLIFITCNDITNDRVRYLIERTVTAKI
jgi:hypothetical protein